MEALKPGEVCELEKGDRVVAVRDNSTACEPTLPDGLTYGGQGPGGEYYSKDINDLASTSIWTKGEECWTAEELRAIADHQDWLKNK